MAVSEPVSAPIQDYAKAVYALESRGGGGAVSTNDLADRLGVTPGSVSGMVRKLAELIQMDLGRIKRNPILHRKPLAGLDYAGASRFRLGEMTEQIKTQRMERGR